MKFKLLLIFAITLFIFQVAFSLFYSIAIVDQSSKFNQKEKKLQTETIKFQDLQIKMAQLNSIPYIASDSSSYLPINNALDLNQ